MLFRGVLVVGKWGGQQARAPLVGQLMCGLACFPTPLASQATPAVKGGTATAAATVTAYFRRPVTGKFFLLKLSLSDG